MRRGGMLRAGVTTFGGVVFGAVATFILTGAISNTWGAADTGLYFQAIALFAIATSTLQLGADTALVRTLSRLSALGAVRALRPTVWQAVLPVLAVGVGAAGAIMLAAEQLAAVLAPASAGEMAELLRTAAPFLPAGALLVVLLGGTRGVGSTLPYTLLFNVGLPLLRLLAGASAVALGLGLQALVALWAAPLVPLAITAAVILAVQVTGAAAADPRPAPPLREQAGPFWRFALPRGCATLLERGLDWGGVLLVLALAGPAQGAIYAIVNRCASAGSMIDQAARVVTGPRISRALAVGDHAAAERLFLNVTRALILVSWPFYLTLAIFAPVVLALFGPEFPAGAPALTVVALALMVATTAGMVQSILLMGGRSSWQLMNRTIQLATLLGVTWALVPPLGILGAAIGWVVAIAVDTALATTQVAVRMRIRSSVRLVALPALASLAVVGGSEILAVYAFGASLATLAGTLPVTGVLYLAAVALLRDRLGLTAAGRPLTAASHPDDAAPRHPHPSAESTPLSAGEWLPHPRRPDENPVGGIRRRASRPTADT